VAEQATIDAVTSQGGDRYKYGFVTDIESEKAPKGLTAETVRYISAKKNEPDWMLQWRLESFERWLQMREPDWAKLNYPKIDYQDAYYYSEPKSKPKLDSLDQVDPKLLETYKKLGIPLNEQKILAGVVAVDAVFDSVSVATIMGSTLMTAVLILSASSDFFA
jgi:Fe-S cluster assembly protein SufB